MKGSRFDQDGMALCRAAEMGDLASVAVALAKGVDPNGLDPHGRMPLGMAAKRGHLTVVQALLAAGAKADARDGEAKMALHHAVESSSGCAALLIGLNPKVDARCNVDRSTALHLALRSQLSDPLAADRVSELLEAGADPEALDSLGRTPLALACARGLRSCCKQLFDFGAAPDFANPRSGETALMVAAKLGHQGCVEELLIEGAQVGILDRDGFSALRHAATAGSMLTCEQLMGAGAKHGEKCVQGKTPVDAARKHGHEELADWLSCAKLAVDESQELRAASECPGNQESSVSEPAKPRAKSRL